LPTVQRHAAWGRIANEGQKGFAPQTKEGCMGRAVTSLVSYEVLGGVDDGLLAV
jgi:hypothetical protein